MQAAVQLPLFFQHLIIYIWLPVVARMRLVFLNLSFQIRLVCRPLVICLFLKHVYSQEISHCYLMSFV